MKQTISPSSKPSSQYLTRSIVHATARYILTACYFAMLLPMCNEAILTIASWINRGALPTFNDFFGAAFYVVWAPLSFALPAAIIGLVFATLLTLFKYKGVACVVTPILATLFSTLYLAAYTYPDGAGHYYLSSGMQLITTINTGLISFLLTIVACTLLKDLLIPIHAEKPKKIKHKEPKKNSFNMIPLLLN